ncbi:MAG TPA: hypothetical protein VG816_12675 [Solirubrobacterales bacterium]|nr:hypothetical protein [Solirubrobacterales bacterium]
MEQSEARRLTTICLTERVRHSSDWVREFVRACQAAAYDSSVEVQCALEAELLDASGALDAPPSVALADFLYVTASALPTPRGKLAPEQARREIETGRLLPTKAVEWLVRASVGAVQRHDNAVLLQPFALLASLGLDRRHLHPPMVRWLASEMAARQARCVVDEQVGCPEAWVVDCLLAAGVTVSASRVISTLTQHDRKVVYA